MKNNIIILVFFAVLIIITTASQCKRGIGGYDLRLGVKNNSNGSIYFSYSTLYPNMNINPFPITKAPENWKLTPNDDKTIYIQGSWESIADTIPGKNLIFFFFDAHTLETTNWDTVIANNMILERKVLSLDSIEKIGWTVTYP
jgi:hypothetical protein